MLKLTKKTLLIGAAATVTTAAVVGTIVGITISNNSNNSNSNNSKPHTFGDFHAKDGVLYPTIGQTIDGRNGVSFAKGFEAKRDPSKWYSTPILKDWSNYNPYLAYWNAVKSGWNEDSYSEFTHWTYSERFKSLSSVFGYSPWSLFYFTFTRSRAYHDKGHTETKDASNYTRQRWEYAIDKDFNHIDDTIPWYSFRSDSMLDNFFTFNNKNLQNGWKRLESIKVLQPVNIDDITAEKNEKDELRNHYLVNGKFVAKADLNHDLKYWKVSRTGTWGTGGDDYVRDDNGWICYVALSDLPNGGVSSRTDGSTPAVGTLDKEIYDLFFYNLSDQERQKHAKDRDYSNCPVINPTNKTYNDANSNRWDGHANKGKEVVYPADYVKLAKYDQSTTVKQWTGVPTNAHESYYWQGKYTLVSAGDTFTHLLKDKVVVFPYEANNLTFSHGDGHAYSRFGRPNMLYNKYYHGEHGSWGMWAWVEDGNGGHKIYKSPDFDSALDKWRNASHDKTINVWYGNSNFTYATKEDFEGDTGQYGNLWY